MMRDRGFRGLQLAWMPLDSFLKYLYDIFALYDMNDQKNIKLAYFGSLLLPSSHSVEEKKIVKINRHFSCNY